MSERKVLNKYYPPEFDPSKIPKLKQKKTGVFSIRIMAPFNMRCNTCGEYIYKGKKFNSRKENVDDEDYLGLRIFRFYIKCPRCVAEIAFKTDLENTDYALEAGAKRLFEAEKLAHKMAEEERKQKEEDEMNPMKVLENRTKASRNEMEQIDQLEELKEMNARHARVDHENMLKQHMAEAELLLKLEEEEEDKLVRAILKKGNASSSATVRRIEDEDSDDESLQTAKKARQDKLNTGKATDLITDGEPAVKEKKKAVWERSVGSFSSKTSLAGLVKRKTPSTASSAAAAANQSSAAPSDAKQQTKIDQDKKNIVSAGASSSTDTPAAPSGLGLLGGYSDSSEEEESS